MKILCPTCKDELLSTINQFYEIYNCSKCKFHLNFNPMNNELTSYFFFFKKNENTYVLNSYNMLDSNVVQTNLQQILKMDKPIFPIFSNIKIIATINKFIPPKDYSNINDYMYIANKLFKLNIFS